MVQRFLKLKWLVQRAEILEKEKQELFISSECQDDPELAAQARSLLQIELATSDMEVVDNPYAILENPKKDHFLGRCIGNWQIINKICEGGMGAVFLASRIDSFKMKGALKVLKYGSYSNETTRRFRHERQILAGLQHPNIARLLDGGATKEGTPYLVMEFVEGERIDHYCNSRQLNIKQRLNLFHKVCKAVSYAHRNLIVHRDLKPANILVTAEGEPVLLDFGIAKLLDADAPDLTGNNICPMTPEYASPEQVQGKQLSTASDIYSLGVLAYELLTGNRPYYFENRRPYHVLDMVCHRIPLKPSLSIRKTMDPAKINLPGDKLPERASRQLSGDLDNIIMKSLEKDPADRYESVDKLADDIQCFLDGRPVSTHAPTPFYVLRKMLKLHKRKFSVAAAFLLMFTGFLAHSRSQVKALQQKQIVIERERDNAESSVAFLENIFEWSQPYSFKGEAIPIQQLLDFAVVNMEREMTDQPLAHARLATLIGSLYLSLGYHEPARKQLEKGYFIRKRLLGQDHDDFLASMYQLGMWRYKTGDYSSAGILFSQTLRAQNQKSGPSPEMADSLHAQATVLQMTGKNDEAKDLFERALSMRKKILGDQHPSVGDTLIRLAMMHNEEGSYEKALALLDSAVSIYTQAYGASHPKSALAIRHQARAHLGLANFAKAEKLAKQAFRTERSLAASSLQVAESMELIAKIAITRCHFESAEDYLKKALAIRLKRQRNTHPELAQNYELRGTLYLQLGFYYDAEIWLNKAILLKKEHLVKPNLAHVLNLRARTQIELGQKSHAALSVVSALNQLPTNHPESAVSYENLGRLHAKQDANLAEKNFRKALQIRRFHLNPRNPQIAETISAYASFLIAQDRLEEAAPLCWEALAISQGSFRKPNLTIARDLENLAWLFLKKKDSAMASKLFQDVQKIHQTIDEPSSKSDHKQLAMQQAMEEANSSGAF